MKKPDKGQVGQVAVPARFETPIFAFFPAASLASRRLFRCCHVRWFAAPKNRGGRAPTELTVVEIGEEEEGTIKGR